MSLAAWSEERWLYSREILPYNRLMGMCCWMGSHFHDWIDDNGVAFSIDLEWVAHFRIFWGKTVLHILLLANLPECLHCGWKVKCSSISLKNRSIHENRK